MRNEPAISSRRRRWRKWRDWAVGEYVKPSEDKEAIARQIVAEQKIAAGPVCVIKSVEPCWSYDIYRSREEKKLKLVKRPRQCLFLYHYQIHPVFGFMNAGFSRGSVFRCRFA